MTRLLSIITFLLLAQPQFAGAQIFSKENHARILPTDKYRDILRKAANICPSERQLHWQQLELTAFIHFGINTFTGREWGDGTEAPALFKPTAMDAHQWVKTCKAAGIHQLILTAKHHDGFCLWPSAYTKHSVKNSPWKNGKGDVVKETADACREAGIGFGIYLSPWDRNSPYFGDSAQYNAYFMNQLTELLTQYGKIDEVWFDGANDEGPNGKKQVYDFNRWYALIRKLQPGAVIAVMGPDVRWVGTESGYGRATEWSVVPMDLQAQESIAAASQKEEGFVPRNLMEEDLGSRSRLLKAKDLVWYPAEIDVSIRPGWFYHSAEDDQVKTPAQLMDIYCSSVGRNGVLLLNLPPDTRGLLHENDVQQLKAWRRKMDSTFSTNLLTGARVKASSGKGTLRMLDGNYDTYWTTASRDTTATIEFTLSSSRRFDLLQLQENIRIGQRIENFRVEYRASGQWHPLTEGTTIGYKRILRFPSVTADALRITIISSRLNPALSEVGLYKQP